MDSFTILLHPGLVFNIEVLMTRARRVSRRVIPAAGQGIPTDPDSVKRAVAEVMAAPLVDIVVMSTVLGIGRDAGYEEAKKGSFGAFKVAGQYRIPTAPLREALHLPSAPMSADHAACIYDTLSASHSNAA